MRKNICLIYSGNRYNVKRQEMGLSNSVGLPKMRVVEEDKEGIKGIREKTRILLKYS